MEHIELYIGLLAIVVLVGVAFRNSTVPTSLLLVIVGMLISFMPNFPPIRINSEIVFNVFLPLLLYEASSYSSTWNELKRNIRPIALLSVGHVIFITLLVALTIHYLIPAFSWPMAIILGAVISPPDDVAIMAIAEKVRMPNRVLNVLKGEAMMNDATALIIYRFALITLLTHQFSFFDSVSTFFIIVVAETLYGFLLATMIGNLRLKIQNPSLQMMISILTPFLAYLPAVKLGGSGVVATVATGLFIGNYYWDRYPPDVRLTARAIWDTMGYGIQSILFLLVGLDLKYTITQNPHIPYQQLLLYSGAVIFVVIVGRFIWVYPSAYIPRWMFASIRKKEPTLPWQYPFVISWAGMRGGISLAAALAVPALPMVGAIDPRALLVFLVFSVIIATLLLQGLSLPWLLNLIGVPAFGKREAIEEHTNELMTRAAMVGAVLKWLSEYELQEKKDGPLAKEIKLRLNEYAVLQERLNSRLQHQEEEFTPSKRTAIQEKKYLLNQIIEIERAELALFWRENKIDQHVRSRLVQQLDLRAKHVEDIS